MQEAQCRSLYISISTEIQLKPREAIAAKKLRTCEVSGARSPTCLLKRGGRFLVGTNGLLVGTFLLGTNGFLVGTFLMGTNGQTDFYTELKQKIN